MDSLSVHRAVAERAGVTMPEAKAVITAYIAVIKEALLAGDKINMPKFGMFAPKFKRAKKNYNPHTGEFLVKPAHYYVSFKPYERWRFLRWADQLE